jgi:NSS family neurotransmitter:Na+ symporter
VALAGVRQGIETINRIVLPLLGITVSVLAAVSLSLPGSVAGVRFLLEPDWSALMQPGVYLAALGQSFFSLGIAMGVVTSCGGYLNGWHHLHMAAVTITIGDIAFALIAGLAIFPAVFAYSREPAQRSASPSLPCWRSPH